MGLIGVVLASVVGSSGTTTRFQFVLSFIGVILFTGLTAYDAQRLKAWRLPCPKARPAHTPSSAH